MSNHRAERSAEHEMFVYAMLNDAEFNPETMVAGLFNELPFTSEELLQLCDTVTSQAGALILTQHPNSNQRVKAKLFAYLVEEEEPETDEDNT